MINGFLTIPTKTLPTPKFFWDESKSENVITAKILNSGMEISDNSVAVPLAASPHSETAKEIPISA